MCRIKISHCCKGLFPAALCQKSADDFYEFTVTPARPLEVPLALLLLLLVRAASWSYINLLFTKKSAVLLCE